MKEFASENHTHHDHEDCNDCGHDHGVSDYEVNEAGTYERAFPRIGRNDPCFCGSGKKHKKCCL